MTSNRLSFDPHTFCALPLVRRAYQAVAVGVAVFIVTLVVLREPFRGYLAEVSISGPPTEGLDLAHAVSWLKQTDRNVAVVASRVGGNSAKAQIRATFVADRPTPAMTHLDELAERWLYQYLPDRMLAYRHAALAGLRTASSAAREKEDAARTQLEAARQKQLGQVLRKGMELQSGIAQATRPDVTSSGTTQENPQPADEPKPEKPAATMPFARQVDRSHSPVQEVATKATEKLEQLRVELSQLLANFTEEHPQVITIRKQISSLEAQIRVSPGETLPPPLNGPTLGPQPTTDVQTLNRAFDQRLSPAHRLVSTTSHASANRAIEPAVDDSGSTEVAVAFEWLAKASRERQLAEQRLSDRMQELSNRTGALSWTAGRAVIITRLGGTPRSSTLALASLLAGVAGVVVFRSASGEPCTPKIGSTGELASALELPVVGNLLKLRAAAGKLRRRLFTPERARLASHVAEAIVAVAVVACLASIAMEPTLARQVLADPFGTLSEVLGRRW
jgi:hypothetical protein